MSLGMGKDKFIIVLLCGILGLSSMSFTQENELRVGDVVFQDSHSSQSDAIKLATESKYSHCGIVFQKDRQWYVLEAVQPVRVKSLAAWKKQGVSFQRRSFKDQAKLTPEVVKKMVAYGTSQVGKNYDWKFDWSDGEMYCSELVWKIYKNGAGVELCAPRPLKDYKLGSPVVRDQLKKRYGATLPLQEPMVSPEDLFRSGLLE